MCRRIDQPYKCYRPLTHFFSPHFRKTIPKRVGGWGSWEVICQEESRSGWPPFNRYPLIIGLPATSPPSGSVRCFTPPQRTLLPQLPPIDRTLFLLIRYPAPARPTLQQSHPLRSDDFYRFYPISKKRKGWRRENGDGKSQLLSTPYILPSSLFILLRRPPPATTSLLATPRFIRLCFLNFLFTSVGRGDRLAVHRARSITSLHLCSPHHAKTT